jgi:hypothetical protein
MNAQAYYRVMHRYFRSMLRMGRDRASYLSVVPVGMRDAQAAVYRAAQQAVRDAH